MAAEQTPTRLKDLIRLLDGLRRMYAELATVVERKIDAMRRVDLETLSRLTEAERALTARIREREGLRRQLMEGLGRALGQQPSSARTMTVSQLARQLTPNEARDLLACAEHTRKTAVHLAQVNRVADVITREILFHMQCVFASVRPAGTEPAGYALGGAPVSPSDARILDAVG